LKPSHELYGEVLAAAGKHQEAIAEFQTGLKRTPNRTASLLGLARSAVAVGDSETAAKAYETLQRFLADANPDVAFLAEVRGYQASTEDR
jgi:cytochrome c-type biogenesis protein CcmH/NrfG